MAASVQALSVVHELKFRPSEQVRSMAVKHKIAHILHELLGIKLPRRERLAGYCSYGLVRLLPVGRERNHHNNNSTCSNDFRRGNGSSNVMPEGELMFDVARSHACAFQRASGNRRNIINVQKQYKMTASGLTMGPISFRVYV